MVSLSPAASALPADPGMPEDRTLRPAAAASVLFRLADDAVLAFLGDRNVVFSGRRQHIYELNEAAAYLACRLERGASYGALVADLVASGLAPGAAADALNRWLAAWSREGIACAELAPRPAQEGRRCALSAGPANFMLLHDDPALLEAVLPAFRHLVVQEEAARTGVIPYRLAAADGLVFIARGGEKAAIVTPAEAAPALKAMLVEDVLGAGAQQGAVALHAACLLGEGGALLLGGSPGAGKSTLTLALLDAGFGYGGDDVTLLDAAGRVQGVPFAPAMKAGAARLMPALKALPLHRRPDGKWLRYRPVEAAPRPGWHAARRLVRLQRRRGAAAALVPMEPVDALAAFMKEAWSPSRTTSPTNFRALRSLVAGAECHALSYWDLDEAVRLLKRHCRPRPPRHG